MQFNKNYSFLNLTMLNGKVLSFFSTDVTIVNVEYEIKQIKTSKTINFDSFLEDDENQEYETKDELDFSKFEIIINKNADNFKELLKSLKRTKIHQVGFDGEKYYHGTVPFIFKREKDYFDKYFKFDDEGNLHINLIKD